MDKKPGWHDIESTEGPMRNPTYCDEKIQVGIPDKRPDWGNKKLGGQEFASGRMEEGGDK